jgi:hypothetical protein
MLFGVLGLLGAITMFVAVDDQVVAGAGFALAVLAGSLSIAAFHLYE